jgi:hypothetical protein
MRPDGDDFGDLDDEDEGEEVRDALEDEEGDEEDDDEEDEGRAYYAAVSDAMDAEEEYLEEEEDYEALVEELGEDVVDRDELRGMDREERREFVESMLSEDEYQEILLNEPGAAGKRDDYTNVCWRAHHARLAADRHQRRQECGWLKCNCASCWCDMPNEMKANPRYKVRCEHIIGAQKCPTCHAHPINIVRGVVEHCGSCNGKGFFRADRIPF